MRIKELINTNETKQELIDKIETFLKEKNIVYIFLNGSGNSTKINFDTFSKEYVELIKNEIMRLDNNEFKNKKVLIIYIDYKEVDELGKHIEPFYSHFNLF